MKASAKKTFLLGRYYFLLGLLCLGFVGLLARIIQLQFVDNEFLQDQGNARTVRTVSMHASRGIITDRHGEPLAVTTPADSIWVNPKQLLAHQPDLRPLAQALGWSLAEVQHKLKEAGEREFVYLRRQVDPDTVKRIKALAIPGVYSQREYRRYYPIAEVASQVVGFTNVDDVGQEGMELAYESWLRGRGGHKRVLKDRLGHIVAELEHLKEPVQGHDLNLSLDRRLQYLAYKELKAAVTNHAAKGGSLVILDVRTGEVLAMVNQPSFNPNNRADIISDKVRNRAVTDVFEPGSVMKAFSMAVALEKGGYQEDKLIDTNPGWLRVDDNVVRDIRNFGVLDLTGIIRKSSNVGISKLLLPLPANTLASTLRTLGFGEVTHSEFPGEQPGKVVFPLASDHFSQATQAFGYGLSVTTLQLAQAYATLGAKGLRRPTTFLKRAPGEIPHGKRVLSQQTAERLLRMLATVIHSGGSGTRARVPGYEVTGKTGTSRKASQTGYSEDKHQALFAGLIPASQPRLAAVVMIDEPSAGKYYGGVVAAPVFAQVMAGAVRLLDITPDNLLANKVLT